MSYTTLYARTLQGNIKSAAKILQIKTHLFLERIRQHRTFAPLDQKRSHLGDLAKGVMLTHCPFEIARSAGAACAHAQSDHSAYHQEMPVTPVGKQLVNF